MPDRSDWLGSSSSRLGPPSFSSADCLSNTVRLRLGLDLGLTDPPEDGHPLARRIRLGRL